MSLIKNLVKEPDHKSKTQKPKAGEDADADSSQDATKPPRPIVRTATDLQRLKLEKLMKNPDKPINIPEPRREKDYMQSVPSFVRNVMGSSAGAGSGEFHVYRHLRRKEYARQKTIQAKSTREQMDDDYQQKLHDNRRAAEEKTAKKRAKRQKRKQQRTKRPRQQNEEGNSVLASDSSENGEEEDNGNADDEAADKEQETPAANEPQTASEMPDEQTASEMPDEETASEMPDEETASTEKASTVNDDGEDGEKANTETIEA